MTAAQAYGAAVELLVKGKVAEVVILAEPDGSPCIYCPDCADTKNAPFRACTQQAIHDMVQISYQEAISPAPTS